MVDKRADFKFEFNNYLNLFTSTATKCKEHNKIKN